MRKERFYKFCRTDNGDYKVVAAYGYKKTFTHNDKVITCYIHKEGRHWYATEATTGHLCVPVGNPTIEATSKAIEYTFEKLPEVLSRPDIQQFAQIYQDLIKAQEAANG